MKLLDLQRSLTAESAPGNCFVDKLIIKGLRSIRDTGKLELRPLNVLIGANGSGKSNFLEGFSLLRAVQNGKLVAYADRAGGVTRLLHFGPKVTPAIILEVSLLSGRFGYHIELGKNDVDGFLVQRERCWLWAGRDKRRPGKSISLTGIGGEAGLGSADTTLIHPSLRLSESWRVHHFHDTGATSPIKANCSIRDDAYLRPDGANLAAFLYMLKHAHPADYALIRATVQQVAPFFHDFQLEPGRGNREMIRLQWKHKRSDDYFDISSLSDGTIRFICLATLFLQPAQLRPSILLVDEPELGLHPYAITVLAALARSASVDRQVILSTQSSFLLDGLEPEDVLVADLCDGATSIRRLTRKKLGTWLKDYSLGELWEKNELGGRLAHQ